MEEDVEENSCCVCFETFDTKCIRLSEVNLTEESGIYYGPCDKHRICRECIRRIVLNFESHPVNENSSMVPCMSPFEECETIIGVKKVFMHEDIEKVLTEEERECYRRYVKKYRFPGYEVIECPMCNTENPVPIEKIKSMAKGYMIVTCVQNRNCRKRWCYNCNERVSSYMSYCKKCMMTIENKDKYGLNRYFKTEMRLLRNNEITEEIAVEQVMRVINMDKMRINCVSCDTMIEKTEKCNGITHCGIEMCYSCGRSGTKIYKLGDHWSERGVAGCPRWDSATYWNDVAKVGLKCKENECYGEEIGDCDKKEHIRGIMNMNEERKKAFVYHMIKSLIKETREPVIDRLRKICKGKQKKYLPTRWIMRIIDEYSEDYEILTSYSEIVVKNILLERNEYKEEPKRETNFERVISDILK